MARNVKTLGAALSRTNKPLDAEAADARLSDFVSGMQQMAFKNTRAGIGTARDMRVGSDYVPTVPINRVLVESLYRGSWLGNRIICALPEEMIRTWRKVSWEDVADDDDDVKVVERYEKRVKLKKCLLTASKWARAYGGALLVPILRSQPDEVLAEPLDLNQIQKDDLVGFQVMDRWRCNHDGTVVADPLDPAFGQPARYRIAESSVLLHHTRVIRLDGREVPYFIWRANAMWHDSVLQILINNLKGYDTVVAAITTMLFQSNVDIILQQGLRTALTTKNGKANAIERFAQFVMNKSFNGVGVLDKDTEEYQRHPYTFSGVDKAYELVLRDVAGAADMPLTRLFGVSPAGMNATGEADDRHFYDHVASRREEHIDDPLMQADEFLVRSALGHMPDGYESKWNPLWQPTDIEKEQADASHVQTLNTLWNTGAIDEGNIAQDIYARGMVKGFTKQHVKNAERVAKQSAEAQQQGLEAGMGPGGITLPGKPGAVPFGKKALQNQVVNPDEEEGEEEEDEPK